MIKTIPKRGKESQVENYRELTLMDMLYICYIMLIGKKVLVKGSCIGN